MKEIVQTSLSWANHFIPSFKTSSSIKTEPFLEEEQCGDHIFLNTDGAVQLNSGNVTVGGVVRDVNEDWIFGYNRHIGRCSIFYAELWGIFERLKLIQRRVHDKVTIQTDSLEVVKTILDNTNVESNSTLIRRIRLI